MINMIGSASLAIMVMLSTMILTANARSYYGNEIRVVKVKTTTITIIVAKEK